MTVQISRLLLVSHDNRVRELRFRLGALNVITGASKTGKTSLLDIVDYCIGRETFTIAEGVIRQRVSWFAVVLSTGNEELLIARPAPATGRQSSALAYLARGAQVALPPAGELEPNTNTDGVLAAISELIGLEPTPSDDVLDVMPNYALTPRNAAFLMFQRQDEIISRENLFHRQGEDFVARSIRESLPFFLGAVTPGDLILLRRLEELRREIRRTQARIAELERLTDSAGTVARRLLDEALALNLLPSESPAEQADPRARLEAALSFNTDVTLATGIQRTLPEDVAESRRRELLGERERLRAELRALRDRLGSVREITSERSEYGSELEEQRARLRSLEILPADTSLTTCPVCSSELDEETPTVAQLNVALGTVSEQLANLPTGGRTAALIDRLEGESAELRRRLAENADTLSTLDASTQALQAQRDERQQQARVLGRISLYLETARGDDRLTSLSSTLARLVAEAQDLEARISPEVIAARVDYALSRVAADMSAQAQQIALEYAASPLRVDPRRLTVVADTPTGQVPMNQMGSGENWVGCHLIAHLSLHAWLAHQDRPVINTVMFDQPSQVYFPSDREWDTSEMGEGDRAAAERLLRLLHNEVVANSGSFQVILTDHADLQEDWFQESIVERWRGGLALVPDDWPEAGA